MGRKNWVVPSADEGFAGIAAYKPPKPYDASGYKNKAIFLDIDGTLRITEHLPNKYPTHPSEVTLREGDKMRALLRSYLDRGYRLIGVSNQSGIAKGTVSEATVEACMNRTKELLGIDFEIQWCPHRSAPISCYCRKPQSGMAVLAIEKYGLDPSQCLMIGDMTTDKTFAQRVGIPYQDIQLSLGRSAEG
jgi:histidinol-phosphate phosphatase family protein